MDLCGEVIVDPPISPCQVTVPAGDTVVVGPSVPAVESAAPEGATLVVDAAPLPSLDLAMPTGPRGPRGLQGPPGEPGIAGDTNRVISDMVAGETLAGHRVVVPTAGGVVYADAMELSHAARGAYLTLGSALAGAPVTCLLFGWFEEISWNWGIGPLFLGAEGTLVSTPPIGAAFHRIVAYAHSARVIEFAPQQSIHRGA